jgi:16S rRNA (uracil1498-N3)-methyltransferase
MKKNTNSIGSGPVPQSTPRLFIESPLAGGSQVACSQPQAHYLGNVMRLSVGDQILLFNGQDGEWLAQIKVIRRGDCQLIIGEQIRQQSGGPDIEYLFAPVKKARLDFMVQKATELGVAALRPVITRRTNAERVKIDRMRANVIEAAEQCGVLRVPEVVEPVKLQTVLKSWESGRTLIFCDESAPVASPIEALQAVPRGPSAILIGPEGGFDDSERQMLQKLTFVHAISLGPRVMRADTAAVAALALINATLGDWL